MTDSSRRLGRGMVYLAWILVAALLTWLFSDWLERQRNPNRQIESRMTSQQLREIVLERNRFGHYVASGRINGQAVEFLLDTGATFVSVPQDLARRLGLRRGQAISSQTANGVIETYATRLASVSVGDLELRDVAAAINPYASGSEVLLGMTFLKHLDIEQRGSTLTLKQRR